MPLRISHWRRDVLFFLVAALVVTFYATRVESGFPLDDSWIHQVYGRNLAQTGQWAFVPGVPSAASTSPLYTVLLSMGYRLHIPFPLWTHALGVLTLGMAAVLGVRMGERLLPGQKLIGLLCGVALALSWHLIWSAASGMETMLFSMMTLVLMYVTWLELDNRSHQPFHVLARGVIFGVLAALATLARPEGIVLAGLCGLVMLIVHPQGVREFIFWAIGVGVGFALAIAPYLVLNLQLTGGLLPNTAAAKQAEYAPILALSYPARLVRMTLPILAGAQMLFIPGVLVFAVLRFRQLRINRKVLFELLPLCWIAALIGLYAARLPADYQHGRYVIPAIPALVLVGIVGTAYLVQWGRNSLIKRVLTRALAIAAILMLFYLAFILGPSIYRTDVSIINEEMVASAYWIHDNIPPEELLVVHDIGAVGYFAPRPILDIAGLVSPEVIPIIVDGDALWQLMRERDGRYLMAFPNQIPGSNVNDSRLCPVYTTGGEAALRAGGGNMTIYTLAWDGTCGG